MIKVKKTDSIVDILIKMKDIKDDKIVLSFPFAHPILHNYTSLKILKTKAGKKELIIFTNDLTAKKIGKKLTIKYQTKYEENIIGHNYNFWEYLVYTIKSYFKEIPKILLTRQKDGTYINNQKIYGSGKIVYFVWFLVISILLLFFVFYFAVNKTYVYIKPEIEVKYKSKNVLFREASEDEIMIDDNVIKLKKIGTTVNLRNIFGSSGIKDSDTSRARGKVIVYNLFEEESNLVKNTRLQTEDGIVFLIENEINIPKALKKNGKTIPGKKEINIVARVKDSKGEIIGKNGNIKKGVKLFLPGLKENKDKIYAISISNFKGGTEKYKKILTKDDIKRAKDIMKTRLEKLGFIKLKEKLKENNKLNNVEYEILEVKDIVKYSDLEITGMDNFKIGEEIDKFELFGTIKAETYIYNKELLLNKLKNNIKENVLNSIEKISNIDEKSLDIVLELKRMEKPLRIKATVQIEAFFIQNFLNDNNGYVAKLKNQIIGKDKEQAERILINNKKVSNAKIKIRPFFINKVSNLEKNIEFIVTEK